jgi:hypothetical protein
MADITTQSTTALENMADAYVKQSTDTQVSLARVFSELFAREAHDEHDMPFADYWRDMRGISPETFTLAYAARRELVSLTPDATLAEQMAMTGASKPTIARDRVAVGVANPDKQAPQEGKHDKPADAAYGSRAPPCAEFGRYFRGGYRVRNGEVPRQLTTVVATFRLALPVRGEPGVDVLTVIELDAHATVVLRYGIPARGIGVTSAIGNIPVFHVDRVRAVAVVARVQRVLQRARDVAVQTG